MRGGRISSRGVVHERRVLPVEAPPEVVWSCVADLGAEPGWYAATGLWRLRFLLDGMLGGPGRRPRPDRPLRQGDPVEGWVVSAVEPGSALTLTSQLRMPGTAVLRHEVSPDPDDRSRSRLLQDLTWGPDGAAGRLLWAVELPAHVVVMRAMVRGMAREAERRAGARDAG